MAVYKSAGRTAVVRVPWWFPVGLVLLGVSWGLYWTVATAWSAVFFFGLWLG